MKGMVLIMKKRSVKKTVGWILIVVQIMGIFGNLMSGGLPSSVPGLLGFFSFAIVGIILLVLDSNNKKN